MLEGEHARLVEIALPVCAEYGLALAGGYAIKAHGLVSRPSDDIDFATCASAPMGEIITALANAYRSAGLAVKIRRGDARKGHLDVGFASGGVYRVDVLKEPLSHPPAMLTCGPVVALPDVVGMKVCALQGRALPRDAIDVHAASELFSGFELITLGRRILDDEFSVESLREALEYVLTYGDDEFAFYGCSVRHIAAIRVWAQEWADQIGMDLAVADEDSNDR